MDGSPIIDTTPTRGLYLNTGWCYGGFKATPASGWCFEHLIATGESHGAARGFKLNRFDTGYVVTRRAWARSPTCTETMACASPAPTAAAAITANSR